MRNNFLYRGMMLLASALTIASCTNEAEEMIPQGSRALDVQVAVNPISRAMVHGTALPGGSSIGINVTDATGNPYDGKDAGYLNVQYIATGEAGAQTWAPATDAVLLSGTEGKMHAYYPWKAGIDYKAVAVNVADQTDWMYAAEAYTVSDVKNTAEIILSHAQTAVNVNLVRHTSYTGVGAVEALTVTSEGLASTATLDTRDGSFVSVTGANTAISIIEAPYTLDGTTLNSKENPYMLIPASTEIKGFTVSATLDGKSYSHKVTMTEAFAPGKVYKINVTFKNTGLEVSTVTLVDWNEETLPDAEFKPLKPDAVGTINLTTAPSGVYAVAKNGLGVAIADADKSCVAVALIDTEAEVPQRFMIEKYEGKNPNWVVSNGLMGNGMLFYTWGPKFGEYDYPGIENMLYDAKNYKIITSNKDWDGKGNTQALRTYKPNNDWVYGDFPLIIDVLDTFLANDDPGKNGWNDWYIPAYGQLELMYKNKSQINTALANMEGAALNWSDNSWDNGSNGIYWSSSELEPVDDLSAHHPGINIDKYGSAWFGAYEGYFYASLRVIRDIN